MSAHPHHLIDLFDLDRRFVLELFDLADRLRLKRKSRQAPKPLAGRTAAMVFHKPSLRTRVSFTVGMHELGGDVDRPGFGRGERRAGARARRTWPTY